MTVRHIVLVKFTPGLSDEEIAPLWEELRAIEGKVDGLGAICAGRSESPEKIERGYMHGFTVDFRDWEALAAYQEHPDHRALALKLLPRILLVEIPLDVERGHAGVVRVVEPFLAAELLAGAGVGHGSLSRVLWNGSTPPPVRPQVVTAASCRKADGRGQWAARRPAPRGPKHSRR